MIILDIILIIFMVAFGFITACLCKSILTNKKQHNDLDHLTGTMARMVYSAREYFPTFHNHIIRDEIIDVCVALFFSIWAYLISPSSFIIIFVDELVFVGNDIHTTFISHPKDTVACCKQLSGDYFDCTPAFTKYFYRYLMRSTINLQFSEILPIIYLVYMSAFIGFNN